MIVWTQWFCSSPLVSQEPSASESSFRYFASQLVQKITTCSLIHLSSLTISPYSLTLYNGIATVESFSTNIFGHKYFIIHILFNFHILLGNKLQTIKALATFFNIFKSTYLAQSLFIYPLQSHVEKLQMHVKK